MLLDEPTAGMTHEDVERIAALIKQGRRSNRTVLMVEHNLSVVSTLSDHITVLARGEVLAEGNYAHRVEEPGRRRGVPGSRPWLTRCRHVLHRAPATAPLLAVRDLQAWYGESHILHGVAFDVARRAKS